MKRDNFGQEFKLYDCSKKALNKLSRIDLKVYYIPIDWAS